MSFDNLPKSRSKFDKMPRSDCDSDSHSVVSGPEDDQPATNQNPAVVELFKNDCKRCERFTKFKTGADEKQALEDSLAGVPIIHRKRWSSSKKAWKTVNFQVRDQDMRDVLRAALAKYPDCDPDRNDWTFEPTFNALVHRWDTLQQMQRDCAAAAEAVHTPHDEIFDAEPHPLVVKSRLVNQLMDFLAPTLSSYLTAREQITKSGKVAFDDVWQLFPPGSLCTGTFEGLAYIGRVTKYERLDDPTAWSIHWEWINWNGQVCGYERYKDTITRFGGLSAVTSLDVHPLAMHPDVEGFKTRMVARGRRFEGLRGYNFKQCEGTCLPLQMDGDEGSHRAAKPCSGRAVIDAYAYYSCNDRDPRVLESIKDRRTEDRKTADLDHDKPSVLSDEEDAEVVDKDNLSDAGSTTEEKAEEDTWGPWGSTDKQTKKKKGKKEAPKEEEIKKKAKGGRKDEEIIPMTDEECLMASPWVCGMELKTKQWAKFNVDEISDIAWNEALFDKLVLPKGNKELAWAFVENKALDMSDFDDFVESKGRGLIMLMFGPPGVGKTYTAEAVAEKSRVPLYTLSAAVLGTTPSEVDSTLTKALELCRLWNAMFLLDEADIFLGARNNTDLARNELVALFLTKLEYYEGILFMTTNRIASLDHAFQSRVDLFLPYHDLTPEARRQVWENFIAHAGGEERFDVSDDDIATLSRMRLNGREIKNIAKSATLLSAKGGEKVPAGRLIMLAENRVNAMEMLAKAEKEH